MRLTRRGILTQPSPEEPSRATCEQPRRSVALLSHWHESLEDLEQGYTLDDLFALLRELEDAESLSPLLQCDVPAFLAEIGGPGPGDDSGPVTRLQVSNVAELTNYVEDPSQPDEPWRWLEGAEAADRDARNAAVASLTGEPAPWKLVDATDNDPLTGLPLLRRLDAPRSFGTWTPPYRIERLFQGRGPHEGESPRDPRVSHPDPDDDNDTAYALDLTPLPALRHLELRYDPTLAFWSGPQPGAGDLLFRTEVTITFGAFLRAIFEEIGFHGSPAGRDAARASLEARSEALDRLRRESPP